MRRTKNVVPAESFFPLPLEAFEQYMMAENRPSQPMVSVRQLLLCGRLQREAFESAIAAATARHPLLRSVVRDPHSRKACWVAAGDIGPRVDWGEIGSPLQTRAGEYLDLTVEVGLRIWIRQGPQAAVVTLHVHHACVDGTGIDQFTTDLLAIYGGLTCKPGDPQPSLPALRQQLLAQRGRIPPMLAVAGVSRLGLREKLKKAIRFVARKPCLLDPPRVGDVPVDRPPPFPGIVSHTFTADETQILKRVGKRDGASLNDIILRDLFLVLRAWNQEKHQGDRGRWMRICVPVNLRTEELAEMPAANVVSYGFLTRGHRECEQPAQLLEGICRDTREFKSRGSPVMFLKVFDRIRKFRGGLRLATNPKRCYATVVLSNLGDVTPRFAASLPLRDGRLVAGDVVLRSLRGSPPLTPNTRAVFHAMTYLGEMTIAVRALPELFDLEDTGDLLQRFVAQLAVSMASDPQAANREVAWQASWEERAAAASLTED